MKAHWRQQLLRFLITGGLSTLVQYVLLIISIESLGIAKTTSSALAYGLAAIVNYVLNYHFTFEAKSPHKQTLVRFAYVVSIGLLLNTIAFYLAIQMSSHYILAQCIGTGVTLIFNFIAHKYWTYSISTPHINNKLRPEP